MFGILWYSINMNHVIMFATVYLSNLSMPIGNSWSCLLRWFSLLATSLTWTHSVMSPTKRQNSLQTRMDSCLLRPGVALLISVSFCLSCFFSLCSLYYPYFFSFLCFLSFFLPTLVKIGSSLPLKQYANNNKLMLVKPGLLLSVSSFSIFPSVYSLFLSLFLFLYLTI